MRNTPKWLLQVGFLFLSIPLILIKWKPIWQHFQNPPPPNKTQTSSVAPSLKKQKIDVVIKAMQQEFKFINIQEQPQSVQLLVSENKPISQYVITSKDLVDESFFEKYKYTIETGGDVTQIKIPQKICDHVNTIISQHDGVISDTRIREISKELKGEISAAIGPFSAKTTGNSELIAELLIFMLKMKALESSRLQIFIKGYSDGVINEKNWPQRIKLEESPYNFEKIDVLMPVDPNSKNPIKYLTEETNFLVPQQYKNKHLPNLRAKFIKQDFIEPFSKFCGMKESEIKILHGYNFREPNHKEKRKVQIYVSLFPL
jgi:hypothetical protein